MKMIGNEVNAGRVAPGIEDIDDTQVRGHAHSTGHDSTLMPEPASSFVVSGDAIGDLAKLLAEASITDRRSARNAERAADAAQTAVDSAKVAEMHLKADETRAGGWASGLATVAEGAFQIAGGASTTELAKAAWGGAGKGASASGTIVGKAYDGAKADSEARTADYSGRADAFARTSKAAHDDGADASALFRKVADFLKEMRQAKESAMSAASHWA